MTDLFGVDDENQLPESAEANAADADDGRAGGSGILPYQQLLGLTHTGIIDAHDDIEPDQIQPASIDLRLGDTAYRVRASFLPGRTLSVRDKIEDLCLYSIDLSGGAVFEKGCVYIVPLQESLSLRKRFSGIANPKSSTGRLNIFARVITDNGTEFDRIRDGYRGPLYAEVSPQAFPIRVSAGSRLVQLRLRQGSATFSERELRRLNEQIALVSADAGQEMVQRGGVTFSVDVEGRDRDGLIGYRAKKNTDVVDVDRRGHYESSDFWEPVYAGPRRGVVLDPDDFYILASREAVAIPKAYAAEMVAYDTLCGEFRVHYAGFFDPGFRPAGIRRGRHPRGAGGAVPRGAVSDRGGPDRRTASLRTAHRASGKTLWRRHRFQLSKAGTCAWQTVQAAAFLRAGCAVVACGPWQRSVWRRPS